MTFDLLFFLLCTLSRAILKSIKMNSHVRFAFILRFDWESFATVERERGWVEVKSGQTSVRFSVLPIEWKIRTVRLKATWICIIQNNENTNKDQKTRLLKTSNSLFRSLSRTDELATLKSGTNLKRRQAKRHSEQTNSIWILNQVIRMAQVRSFQSKISRQNR